VPFDGGMCPRNPTAAYRADGGILGENFGQSVRELAAQCSNVVFGALFDAHGSSDTGLEWTCHKWTCHIWPIAIAVMGSRGHQRVLIAFRW
jgi:hypothetical protein